MGNQALTGAIAAGVSGWTTLLSRLVRIPSRFEREHAMVDAVEAHLRALGCPTIRRVAHDPRRLAAMPGALPPVSAVDGRASLVAIVPGRGGPSLTVSTHLDVADEGPHAAWTRPPFSGEIDQAAGRVSGRGAWDDKAGVVCALALAELALRGRVALPGDLVLHFVLEDEITGNGTLLCLADGPRTGAALIVDGTRLDRAIREHAGQARCRITVTGAPVSVAVSHLGVNAAERLAEAVLALKAAVHGLNADRGETWRVFPSPFQASVQRLAAEAPIFTTPDAAAAELHMTFCPPFALASFRARVEEELQRIAAARGWAPAPVITWEGFAAEPVRGGGEALEAQLHAAARRAGGPAIAIGPSTGTSDLRHFAAAGIPCLLHGPGAGFNPHRPDEYYELADLGVMIARLCALTSAA